MLFDFIQLDMECGTALWQQIYEQVVRAVDAGGVAPGTKIPSIRELAEGLCVSRSPVENAYTRLQLDGYIASRARSGYYAADRRDFREPEVHEAERAPCDVEYDLSCGRAFADDADIAAWRRCLRAVLSRHDEITSRGDPCGEAELRAELAAYAYRARGVQCTACDIFVALGTQQLVAMLLRATRRGGRAVIESPGDERTERVMRDFGWQVRVAREGECPESAMRGAEIYVSTASRRPHEAAAQRMARRREIAECARSSGCLVVEDDRSGELCYVSRELPAIQPLARDEVVYIADFSLTLLPSVRIAYMAVPPSLAKLCEGAARAYDAAPSKVEQMALALYIRAGGLDRRIRRCRRAYARRCRLFADALRRTFGARCRWRLIEQSAAFSLATCRARELQAAAREHGVRVDAERSSVLISFASLREEDFAPALERLRIGLGNSS